MLLPIFKSHYSIGKSILTLDHPDRSKSDGGPDSVFDIVNDNKLNEVVLVEDSFMGFLQAKKVCEDLSVKLIFGIRIDCVEDVSDLNEDKSEKCIHKIIIFPKNSHGCALLNKIYTIAKTEHKGFTDLGILKQYWSDKDLFLAIPFYDSFLFKNLTSFNSCIVKFNFTKPTFFIEDNGLPFDEMTQQAVNKYCKINNFPTQNVQSIFYNTKKDFSAYLAYKLICGRNSFSGRDSSLSKPNFDHLGSDEFCWQSFTEKRV